MIFGKHVNRYYLRYAALLLAGLAALAAVDYLQLVIPNLYQMVINGINDGSVVMNGEIVPFDMDFLLDRVCLPMIVVILSLVFGRFLWRVTFFSTAIRVEADLRERMFRNVLRLDRNYYQRNKVGSLMSLFTNDLETVQDCFGWGILMFFDALMLGAMAIYKMFCMNAALSLLTVIPMALLLASATVVGKAMMEKWDARQEAFSRLSDFAQESFSGIAVIKAFVREAKELMAFKKLNKENEEVNVAYTRMSVMLRILVTFFVESVIGVILGYGGYLVYHGVFNAGQLVEFICYFSATIWPIMAVSELIDMTSRGRASVKRISELLDAKPDLTDRTDVGALTHARGEIEMRDLSFRYPDAEIDALSHVSFRIPSGAHVGLVGRTGSGKTTLVDLLLRTCPVQDGTLFFDGQDVNTLSIASVRDACAYVPQDNFLFSDTIESNIAFAADNADPAQVGNAARLADVHENIAAFSDGYGTVLGERGVTVSGGQKQRIAIARALCKDAPVLILDDSVSAVDTKTERTILDNLRRTRAGRTTILIAHRISTVESLDRILFLEEGRLIASGTHSELLASCEAYRRMVALQKLEEEASV